MTELDRQPTFTLIARLAYAHPEYVTDRGWRDHPETPRRAPPKERARTGPVPVPPVGDVAVPRPCHMALVETAREHGILVSQLIGESRVPALVRARWAAMDRMHRAGASASAIGRILRRDHTTVLYGLRRYAGIPADRAVRRNPRNEQSELAL